MGNIFTKRAGEEGAGPAQPATPVDANKIDTIIGPNSRIKGDIHSKGTLRIDGTVEGNVTSDSTIILGEKGVANATLTARQVIIGGTVNGNVVAEERLEILSTGRMYGDVETSPSRFIVAEGVIFEGRCTMSAKDVNTKVPRAKESGAGSKPVKIKDAGAPAEAVGAGT